MIDDEVNSDGHVNVNVVRFLNIIISDEEYFNCQWFSKRVYHQQGILLIKNHLGLIEKNQLINDEIHFN